MADYPGVVVGHDSAGQDQDHDQEVHLVQPAQDIQIIRVMSLGSFFKYKIASFTVCFSSHYQSFIHLVSGFITP